MFMYYPILLHAFLQSLMPMETLFGADGLRHLKANVLVCAGPSQQHLTRLAIIFHSIIGLIGASTYINMIP